LLPPSTTAVWQKTQSRQSEEDMSEMAHDPNAALTIGRYRLDPIADFEGPRMPPAAMFSNTDPGHLGRLLERVPRGSYDASTNQLITSVHSWLVRDHDGMVMLVDTCFGNLKHRRPTHPAFHMQKNDWLLKLAAVGVKPDDVTHVINTHLHLDHVGWNTLLIDGVWTPTFPRARHLMPRVEVEINKAGATPHGNPAWQDSIAPVIDAGLADFVDPGFQIARDIKLVPCIGHSPGMLLVEIAGATNKVIAGGDPLHHPLQILDPDVNTGYCESPEQSAASRWALLARCADEGWAIAATHFFAPRVARISRAGDGFELRE
jgi:glyoxylase-like metal-dependent hydrolase (beta-lactamase superfamily II)